ncbi:MAG: hypothetical protein H8E42_14465 [Nitrospinae bacterium]|nr:hypothetical protein [Nitrospinota bacterium]MBL7019566.1 hypothetical protein [Nitrospinaceae bacterium]
MSTILETLKKLEEDKRLLEKDLDLKELVLREDQKPLATVEIPRKSFIVTGLILAGVIVVAVTFFRRPSTEKEMIPVSQVPPIQKRVPVDRKGLEPTVGIPLSNIPVHRQRYEEKVSENPLPAIKAPVRVIPQPIAEFEPPEINEIRDLIQTATSAAQQPQPNPYPEELVSRGISIPSLKVKGIIFFSSGSPSNHIFVSTSESKNRKVRVGDTVQQATLMNIESNGVVFSYQGETVHLRIGE